MTSSVKIAAILIALTAASCGKQCLAASATPSDRAALTLAVDQLCHWSGMTRRSDLSKIERLSADARWRYTAEADLVVDGKPKHYRLGFDAAFRVMHFTSGYPAAGQTLGEDTLKDRRLRRMCVQAVARLNKGLGWKSAVGPYIQRVGSGFLVTFETVTAEEQKRAKYEFLDPYVSFVVTPKGTVFGGFWGA
ncbi:MAG: hypothetical protein M3Z22_05900 [Verrucomicrobiota bacterium]|nr:hypothetical protein [Verrucomicrobiota bacterium]